MHVKSFYRMQWRRNRWGNGGACPRNSETAGAEVLSFHPRSNLGAEPQKPEWMTPRSNSGTAGELTWRTQNEPKLLVAEALPRTPLGSLQRSPRPSIWWGGAYCPIPKNLSPGSDLRASPRPRNVDFVPTPLVLYSVASYYYCYYYLRRWTEVMFYLVCPFQGPVSESRSGSRNF